MSVHEDPKVEVYQRKADPQCPLRCGFETFDRDVMHDHVSDEHPELWDIIMSGEVFIYE